MSLMDTPKIRVEKEILSDFEAAIRKEWLVTNGLGGYASSTILGINTRKYHGLLVAALNPPVNRQVTLAKLDEEVYVGSERYRLGANEFRDAFFPEGHKFLRRFELSSFPVYTYEAGEIGIQKRIFMLHLRNATFVIYKVHNPLESSVSIRIFPLVNARHFYSVTQRENLKWNFVQKSLPQGNGLEVIAPNLSLIIGSNSGTYVPCNGNWIDEIYFRVDASLGESCLDDCFQPGCFELEIAPNEEKAFYVLAVACRTENEAKRDFSSLFGDFRKVENLYAQEVARRRGLLEDFKKLHNIEFPEWLKWLILAADSFLVKRKSTGTTSVIAGYHWFEDWGRDSLISLPSLTLVTGRFSDAREILETFKSYCKRGIVPNRFPDRSGENPEYNTVDATLWYFNAVLQYLSYTGDYEFVRQELWETLQSMVEYHVKGTMFGVCVEDDGLLAHGPQLTWMDAVVDGKAVTPRAGKAVEIQALWYNALKTMELLAGVFQENGKAEAYRSMAEKAKRSFVKKFWSPRLGYLFDVVRDDGSADATLRPNQIVAASLFFSMLDEEKSRRILEVVRARLLTPYGLKTLPEDDERYVGRYAGNWAHRNHAYHNGTVWPWLLGPFVTAFLKVKKHDEKWRRFAFNNFLRSLFQEQVFQGGLGSISEIFDGDPPHTPQGCISQAWSVAEPLRAYVEDVLMRRPPFERQILKVFQRH